MRKHDLNDKEERAAFADQCIWILAGVFFFIAALIYAVRY